MSTARKDDGRPKGDTGLGTTEFSLPNMKKCIEGDQEVGLLWCGIPTAAWVMMMVGGLRYNTGQRPLLTYICTAGSRRPDHDNQVVTTMYNTPRRQARVLPLTRTDKPERPKQNKPRETESRGLLAAPSLFRRAFRSNPNYYFPLHFM